MFNNLNDGSSIKIAVDAMGGDFAPEMAVKGAILAARKFNVNIVLVGEEDAIKEEIEKNSGTDLSIEICHAPEKIEMGEEPYHLIRKKKNSSIRVAFELVSQNQAQAVVSAGNSGAVVYGALFILKRLRNISRPGIAAMMPSLKGGVLVVDAGANTICRPQNFVQFAVMGSVYYKHIIGSSNPRVGVLSNGEEESKGTELTRHANELLKKSSLNYIGYVEGRDVFSGNVDIIVCDGFAGNVLIKTAEGVVETLMAVLKGEIKQRFFSRVGYLFCRPAFVNLKKRFDYSEYGGAVLLGIDKPVVFGHGSSNAQAFMNAVRVAREYVQKDVNNKLIEELHNNEDLYSLKKGVSFINKIFRTGSAKEKDQTEPEK